MNPSETQCAFDQDPGLASNGQALAVACSASPKTRTERQREASRINGARSRGPRTQLGKARVRQNALVHGIYARCLPLRDTYLFSRSEFSRALAALEEEVRPQSQHARMLMERYLVDSFRLQTLLRLLDHEFDPNHGDRTHLFYGNYWQDVEHPAPVEPYARMALVLRKIRSGFQGEAVVCTEEEMVDAVDVLWLVLHHPDKNVEVRDSQATSRAEFEILFQELLETYKATEKQKPRRRSGKAKPTTLDQLQAVDAASREGLLRVVCERRIAADSEQAFRKLLDESIRYVESRMSSVRSNNLLCERSHRQYMEGSVLPRPDRVRLLMDYERQMRRAEKEDWQMLQEALQQDAWVCSQDFEVLEPENDHSAREAVIRREVQVQLETHTGEVSPEQNEVDEAEVERMARLAIAEKRLTAICNLCAPPMKRRPGTTVMEYDPKQDTEKARAERYEDFLRVMRETSLPLEQGPAKDSPAEISETGQNESVIESAQASETGGACTSSP